MADFDGLGSEMLPMAAAKGDPTTPQRESQWLQYFKNPTVSAALFNMGTALMQPKWNQASILPDALNAGARTVAVNEEEEYKRDQVDEQNRLKQQESATDRQSRMAIAKLQADSRLEVAQERIAGMLAGQRVKAELRGPPGTPHEQRHYSSVFQDTYKQLQKDNETAFLTKAPIKTEEQMRRVASERAQDALMNFRLQFGGPQAGVPAAPAGPEAPTASPVPGEKTRPNPAPGTPPAGMPGVPTLPNSTRQNTPPDNPGYLQQRQAPPRPPTVEAIKKLGGKDDPRVKQIMEDEAAYNYLRERVTDPAELDRYRNLYRMTR